MFVLAAVGCVGLVFVDMGVVDTSGLFAGVVYLMYVLGAVVKLVVAAIFLYFFFVVFDYYKELRDGPSAPQTPKQSTPPRPLQTPPRPPQTSPRSAQKSPRPSSPSPIKQ
ncbi:hypothetical protein V9T40_000451 [Parthenolecanium corni]|uniref:Uncharacterized protein n=1 Tax=Parthenolecanium corni TaxID=536013 RepID=A0AAN9Y0G6_9HEMI